MGNVRIWVGVYGEGSLFPVTIAGNAIVGELEEAIVKKKKDVNQRFNVDPSLLKLYLAKKDGAWLKDDDDLEELLQGEVDKTFPRMRSSWKLNNAAYFGPRFKPQYKDVHVLVELPPAAVSSVTPPITLCVGLDDDAAELIAPYEKVAELLKDASEVSQLVDAVRYAVADTDARPFIVLESSSGMGKTQMAFNLMAREDIDVHYIVCDCGLGFEFRQAVYTAFDARSCTFLQCIKRDLEDHFFRSVSEQFPHLKECEFVSTPKGLRLHTFEFVRALLSGANATQKAVCSYEEVQRVLERKMKQQVVFIDEFPLLNEDDPNHEVKLRFMRNVFRTLKLPVILSSTNGTARGLILTRNSSSRGETDVPWCVVVPRMPRFQDLALERMPRDDIKALLQCSRPLFAQYALEYIAKHALPPQDNDDDQRIISYMDVLTGGLAQTCRSWKRSWSEWFRVGQVCLFLSSHLYDSTALTGDLIQGHFATLKDPEMFELRFAGGSKLVKWDLDRSGEALVGKEPHDWRFWRVRTVFPSIDQDVLLYLSLLGGKNHRAFRNASSEYVSFCEALAQVERDTPGHIDFKNNLHKQTEDSMRLEAMTIAAIVSASHCNGFAGIRLDAFLAEMVFDLGMQRPAKTAEDEDWCVAIPTSFRSRVVPFLAPLGMQWPSGLPTALNLGTMECNVDKDHIDLRVDGGWLTAEWQDELNQSNMKRILQRIKPSWPIHVVVVNQLQGPYFEDESFGDYLATECPHLLSMRFLQYGSGTGGCVVPMSGMDRSEVTSPDRLMLFVARLPLVRQPPVLSANSANAAGDDSDDDAEDGDDRDDDDDSDEEDGDESDEEDGSDREDGDAAMAPSGDEHDEDDDANRPVKKMRASVGAE